MVGIHIHVRELYRTNDGLPADAQRFANRLSEQLRRYYPQMLALCPAGDQPLLWDLLELAPLPETAHQATAGQIAAVLRQRRIRRLTAEQVLSQLRATPLQVAPGAAAAASEHALVLIAQLRVVHDLRKRTLKQLILALRQMRTRRTDAPRPSEASQAVAERNGTALRTHSGVAPVTRQTGKHRGVGMRYACNRRLRNAFYHFAMTSLQGGCDGAPSL